MGIPGRPLESRAWSVFGNSVVLEFIGIPVLPQKKTERMGHPASFGMVGKDYKELSKGLYIDGTIPP
jgi:hypothetical protein